MARSAVQLEGEELVCFHENYAYMWKKLNTAPYYVSGTGETPEWIHDPWLLPSYVNLSKCLNPAFAPSVNIVNKIVQFYNANIKPEVDTYAFLHEKLATSDSVRSTRSYSDTEEFCGLYRIYYYAGIADKKEVYTALAKIAKSHDATSIQMITGITTDRDAEAMQLKELFRGSDIPLDKYKAYRNSLELAKRRTTLYKGMVALSPGMISLEMQSVDRDGSVIFYRLPIVRSMDGSFFGSVGVATLLSGQTSIQILKMAIVRADQKEIKPFSVENEQVRKILEITKTENEHLHLSIEDTTLWNDMIISSAQ